jgi:O-antigen/teichoic acid export membrane protein
MQRGSFRFLSLKMVDKIKGLFSNEFYKSIILLLTGTTFAKFLPFLFALGLARIYSPDNFGDFVFEMTIASILSILATAKYESAIILADSDKKSNNLFSFGIKLSIVVNAVFFLLGLAVVRLGFLGNITLLHLLLIVLYSQFFSLHQLLQCKLTRQKRYKTKAGIEIFRSVVIGAGQFLFFIYPLHGLMAGALLGQVVPILYYAFKGELSTLKTIWTTPLYKNEEALRYINFPKYSLPSELLNFVSSQLPILVFKPLFGNTIMGLYSFSHRYISLPVQLISKSVSEVLVEKTVKLRDRKTELSEVVLGLFKRQFLLGIVVFSILGLWGKELFSLVFGKEWEQAGLMAQYLAPWLFAVLMGSPLSAIVTAFEHQKFSMVFNILLIVFRLSAILLGFYFTHSVDFTIIIYSLTGCLFFCYLTYYSLKLVGIKANQCVFYMLKMATLVFIPLSLIKFLL